MRTWDSRSRNTPELLQRLPLSPLRRPVHVLLAADAGAKRRAGERKGKNTKDIHGGVEPLVPEAPPAAVADLWGLQRGWA